MRPSRRPMPPAPRRTTEQAPRPDGHRGQRPTWQKYPERPAGRRAAASKASTRKAEEERQARAYRARYDAAIPVAWTQPSMPPST